MKKIVLTLTAVRIGAGSLTACSDDDCGSGTSAAAFDKPHPKHKSKKHRSHDDCDDEAGSKMRNPVAILPAPHRFRPVKRNPVAILPAPSWWN